MCCAVLAVGALIPLWWASGVGLLSIAIGAQMPDASVPDGDPCCGHPDTWGQSVQYLGAGLVLVVIAVGLFLGIGLLARYAAIGRATRVTKRLVAASAAAWLAVMAGLWIALAG